MMASEVIINFNMFHVFIKDQSVINFNNIVIVTIHWSWSRKTTDEYLVASRF